MIDSAARTTDCPRWVHYLAVLMVCATLPLLLLGAEVTTRGVGMVDPRGFRWPWEIFALLGQGDNAANSALVIELTHRLFGFLVGILAIGLCVGLFIKASGWKRWLGAAALAAVVAQGLLGRYRVDLNALFGSTLALIHGCFAQLVFAFLVSIALWTSRVWRDGPRLPGQDARLRHGSLAVAFLVFVQIVLGAVIRHKELALGLRAHLLFAFVVVAAVIWLAKSAYDSADRASLGAAGLLCVLVAVQLFLGLETWLSKLVVTWPGTFERVEPFALPAELIRSAHYLVGALIFATSVATALLAHRQIQWQARTAPSEKAEAALGGVT
jgi:cytochrome c oxidase assembly protein subunit 15